MDSRVRLWKTLIVWTVGIIVLLAILLAAVSFNLHAATMGNPKSGAAPVDLGPSKTWPALDAHEFGALDYALKTATPGEILVACGGPQCLKMEQGLVGLFQSHGWKVSTLHDLSVHARSFPNLHVSSCGIQAEQMRDLLQWATARQVDYLDSGSCDAGDRRIYLLIGRLE